MQKQLPLVCFLVLATAAAGAAQTLEIIDASGDGAGNVLDRAQGIAVDAAGNVYVAGGDSDNVFRIGSDGMITEILDLTSGIDAPRAVAVDSVGNVYVSGVTSDNVYRIATPGSCSTGGTPCTITEIIDSDGDGTSPLNAPYGLAVDSSGNVFVSGFSDNVFRIDTPGSCSTGGAACSITELIDGTGDGTDGLVFPYQMAVDTMGNLFVVGRFSDNLFRIDQAGSCGVGVTPCAITLLLDASGDGSSGYDGGVDVTLDASGRLYTSANTSDNILRITNPSTCNVATCSVTEVLETADAPTGLASDEAGNLYFIAEFADEVRRVANPSTCSTSGTACSISLEIGPGAIELPSDLAARGSSFYASGSTSDNAFAGIGPLFSDGFETGDISRW